MRGNEPFVSEVSAGCICFPPGHAAWTPYHTVTGALHKDILLKHVARASLGKRCVGDSRADNAVMALQIWAYWTWGLSQCVRRESFKFHHAKLSGSETGRTNSANGCSGPFTPNSKKRTLGNAYNAFSLSEPLYQGISEKSRRKSSSWHLDLFYQKK